jgi:hypothetical protein
MHMILKGFRGSTGRAADFSTDWLLIIVACAMVATSVQAQDGADRQRDGIKSRLSFDRWPDLLRDKPEVRYEGFKLEPGAVAPWRVQRVQDIGQSNRGTTMQSVLSKSEKARDAEEILRISVTQCASRAEALEGLIDHLLGVQRPSLKLIEEQGLLLGDLAVHFPGTPESSVYFVRGNVLICVENAGKKPAPDLREVARKLDDSLKQTRPR